MRFEAPIMRAGPAKAGLHFIRDTNSARAPHMFVGMLQVAVGKDHHTAHALDRLRDKARDLT